MTSAHLQTVAATLMLALCADGGALAASVGILVEHIETDAATATLLLREGDLGSLRKALEAPIRDGEAEVVDVAYQQLTPGHRGKIECAHLMTYPHDWGPADIAKNIQADVTAEMRFTVPASPGPFAKRSLGNTLECEVNLSGDEIPKIHLSLSTEISWLKTRNSFGSERFEVETPEFESRKIEAKIVCPDREAILVGLHTPREVEHRGRRVFVFATAFLTNYQDWNPGDDDLDDDPFGGGREAEPDEILQVETLAVGTDFIEVDQADLAALLDSIPRREGELSTMRKQVETLIGESRAEVIASQSLRTVRGQRAKVDPGHDYTFPTDWEPAEVAETVTQEMVDAGESLTFDAFAKEFDKCGLGMSMECEPNVSDGEAIFLNLFAGYERHLGTVTWGKWEAKTGHPLFSSMSVYLQLNRMRDGEDILAAIMTPRDEKTGRPVADKRVLCFVWVHLAKSVVPVEERAEPENAGPPPDPLEDPFKDL